MKQPKNEPKINHLVADQHLWIVLLTQNSVSEVDIGYGRTKKAALIAAKRRLTRLLGEVEAMLEKEG